DQLLFNRKTNIRRPLAPLPRDPLPANGAARRDAYGEPLPPGATQRFGSIRWRHDNVSDLAFSPEGRILVTAGGGWLRSWDFATGRLLRTHQLSTRGPVFVTFPTAGILPDWMPGH